MIGQDLGVNAPQHPLFQTRWALRCKSYLLIIRVALHFLSLFMLQAEARTRRMSVDLGPNLTLTNKPSQCGICGVHHSKSRRTLCFIDHYANVGFGPAEPGHRVSLLSRRGQSSTDSLDECANSLEMGSLPPKSRLGSRPLKIYNLCE